MSTALTLLRRGTYGTISGSATDADGKAVANAQVQVKNEAGAQFQAKTSASGSYTIEGYAAKDGSSLANARSVTLPDGRKVFAGSPTDGGPTK